MRKILMVDDDLSFLKIYSKILESNNYFVKTTSNVQEIIPLLEEECFDIVILDIVMPEANGIEILKMIKSKLPSQLVMLLTGEGSISGAVDAMKSGAYTYMIKPLEIEQLLLNVSNAEEFLKIHEENSTLRGKLQDLAVNSEMLGESDLILALKKQIAQIAPTNAAVLITGESGTGKEIIANLIHSNSNRKSGPMIKVNCSALAESLLESELFGHEKGAFTGAASMKKGRFEIANGGTLFLDEIGDMPFSLQSKLLRVLQEKEFERVGSTKTIKVDFRLVCATNKDLKTEIEKGTFREDLYFRINVVPLYSIPLRERQQDILPLMNHFLNIYSNEMCKPKARLSPEAENLLLNYPWKGNVRELKNLAERLIVFSNGAIIEKTMLPEEIRCNDISCYTYPSNSSAKTLKEARDSFEREYIIHQLKENSGNISLTAQKLDIARKNLQAKLKILNIDKNSL